LQPKLLKQPLEHFFKHDLGPKEKKQLLSVQHFSTQDSMFWMLQFLGTPEQTHGGHLAAFNVILPLLFPHENRNKTEISRSFFFISTSISKFRVFVKRKRFV